MSADETEQHLENLIQTLFNVGVTIEEFESDSKELLFRRMFVKQPNNQNNHRLIVMKIWEWNRNEVIMQLEKVEKSAIGLDNEVPVEVLGWTMKINLNSKSNQLRYVDEGKNPDLFTKKCLEDCYVENNTTKGKAHALKVGCLSFGWL